MPKNNPYEKQFIILSEDDMDKLSSGQSVYVDGDKDNPPIFIFTEEGYKKFKEFWSEGNLLDEPVNDVTGAK